MADQIADLIVSLAIIFIFIALTGGTFLVFFKTMNFFFPKFTKKMINILESMF